MAHLLPSRIRLRAWGWCVIALTLAGCEPPRSNTPAPSSAAKPAPPPDSPKPPPQKLPDPSAWITPELRKQIDGVIAAGPGASASWKRIASGDAESRKSSYLIVLNRLSILIPGPQSDALAACYVADPAEENAEAIALRIREILPDSDSSPLSPRDADQWIAVATLGGRILAVPGIAPERALPMVKVLRRTLGRPDLTEAQLREQIESLMSVRVLNSLPGLARTDPAAAIRCSLLARRGVKLPPAEVSRAETEMLLAALAAPGKSLDDAAPDYRGLVSRLVRGDAAQVLRISTALKQAPASALRTLLEGELATAVPTTESPIKPPTPAPTSGPDPKREQLRTLIAKSPKPADPMAANLGTLHFALLAGTLLPQGTERARFDQLLRDRGSLTSLRAGPAKPPAEVFAEKYRQLLIEQGLALGMESPDFFLRLGMPAVFEVLVRGVSLKLDASRLGAADRQFLAQLPAQIENLEKSTADDLQRSVALQQLWLRVASLYAAQQRPQAAERAAAIVRELDMEDQRAKGAKPADRLRAGDEKLLSVWMLLLEEP